MPVVSFKHEYSLELLESLLDPRSSQIRTRLIICAEKKDFISQLLQQIIKQISRVDRINNNAARSTEGDRGSDEDQFQLDHAFLTPTLSLLATSKSIQLAFCPTLPALRAYLSTSMLDSAQAAASEKPARLVVLDLLSLHHGTSEFTVQGLSRTFATLVSSSHQSCCTLTLVECRDINDPSNPAHGSVLWDSQVPLLSGSVKIGQEGTRWAGRSITIRRFAARWLSFEVFSTEPSLEVQAEDADEMLL